MAKYRYRPRFDDRDRSAAGAVFVAAGALAGLAAGVLLAQRLGGLSGIGARVRDRLADARGEPRDRGAHPTGYDTPEYDDEEELLDANTSGGRAGSGRASAGHGAQRGAQRSAQRAAGSAAAVGADNDDGEALEERVLEAFRNDPVLSERAIDIGAVGRGIIELTGYVQAEDESHHAVTVTRGVPGVVTVVNRLEVREEEARYDEAAAQYTAGEADVSPRWEGIQVGTGRTRQGTSQDGGLRHADPKPVLENRWLDEQEAVREAAGDLNGLAERRRNLGTLPPGDETGGSPVAPSGVPKGDHVADPASAEPVLREQTGRVDPHLRGA